MKHNVKSYQRRLKTERLLPSVPTHGKARMVRVKKILQVWLIPEMNL